MMPLQALIFDFDGLLVDTEWPAFLAWSAIYQEHGATLALEEWVACVGTLGGFDPCARLRQLSACQLSDEVLTADKESRKKAICDLLPFMPGVHTVIAQARTAGLKIAVASSSSSDWVTGHLRRLQGLPIFDAVVTKENVTRVKPHPDLYLAAAAALQVPVASCLVCEDSLNGLRAAKSAGMRCIVVPNRVTYVSDFAAADLKLSSLTELDLAALGRRFWPV